MILFYALMAAAAFGILAHKLDKTFCPGSQLVPEAFEQHDHEEVPDINASENPGDWWFYYTIGRHLA